MTEPKLRDGFMIVAGIAVEHRNPLRDEYTISGLQLEKLRILGDLITELVAINRSIKELQDGRDDEYLKLGGVEG